MAAARMIQNLRQVPLSPVAGTAGRRRVSTNGKEKLIVFDTTLRDGEQSPGVTLQTDQKLVIARQLSRLGVTVCEAGFPIASEGDFQAVKAIAKEVGPLTTGRISKEPMVICGLARCKEMDIDRCYEAVNQAPKHRIHTFLATSDIHLEHKLNISREMCLRQIDDMVRYAATLCEDIEFSPEDAGRSDHEFLVQALEVAIKAGAKTLNIPDTVGFNTPEMYGDRIASLIRDTSGSDTVIWSTHCHDDLGLATANTLAGVMSGARQVEVTINGLGERAGNTSLEEVVMAVKVHPDHYPVYPEIDHTQIVPVSHTVASLSGMAVQRNKAIVGANAFAHESGIHQDGVLKHQATYEIISPEDVGLYNHDGVVLGKLSGRHAVKIKLEGLGYTFDDDKLFNAAFKRFKQVADTKNVIIDADLHAIIRDVTIGSSKEVYFCLESLTVVSGSGGGSCTATVGLSSPEGPAIDSAVSTNGPVNALYSAIDKLTGIPVEVDDYRTEAVSEGSDALGEVTVLIRRKDTHQLFSGSGSDADIIRASALAYINALNSLKSFMDTDAGIEVKKEISGP